MKKSIYVLVALTVVSLWFVQSCKKGLENVQLKGEKLVLPEKVDEYYLGSVTLNKQATIGRALFYDKNLSATNNIACASCHFQENAFADGKQFSIGFKSEMTERNSMAFNNLNANQDGFFWDLRETNLKDMVLKPISNHIEMGFTDINVICKKLTQNPQYQKLFTETYPEGLTVENVANSLSSFLQAIKSVNSKFDKEFNFNRNNITDNFPNFTAEENHGKQLFVKDGCINCHNPQVNFQKGWNNWANIGLDLNYKDKGMSEIDLTKRRGGFEPFETGQEGNFKVPSLRNIALTAPYMHDGRFATLNEVLNHYSEGIKNHKNLSWELIDQDLTFGSNKVIAKKFNYTEQDKKALIAFLNTLTDYKMISDPKFSNPFQVEN
ncbi:MAG: cytochrome c peroxidase [Bacteroidota bacterium]